MKTAIALLLLGLLQVWGAPEAPEEGSQLQQLLPAGSLAEGGVVGLARETREAGRKGRKNRRKNKRKGRKGKGGKGRKGRKGVRKSKKGGRKGKKGGRKGKKGGRKGKKGGRKGKKGGRKGVRKNKGKGGKAREGGDVPATCSIFVFKAYSVALTQNARIKRIERRVKRAAKISEAAATIFEPINEACAGCPTPPAPCVALAECPTTVPAACDVMLTAANETAIAECKPLLEAFVEGYKLAFFTGAANDPVATCTALDGLVPDVAALTDLGCLPNTFKVLDEVIKDEEKMCKDANKDCKKAVLEAWPLVCACEPEAGGASTTVAAR